MTPADLATLLDEANHHPWESVQAALTAACGLSHPRLGWLVTHLLNTKREYWALIAEVASVPVRPNDLTALMTWEVGAARALAPGTLALSVIHSGTTFTVAKLLRLNARHTTWHAGQIAALAAALKTT